MVQQKFHHYFSVEKLLFWNLAIIAFLLPLTRKGIPPLIVLWVFLWLLAGTFREKISEMKKSVIFLVPVFFYILHITGLIYTSNLKAGIFDLEVKFSLLLIPLLVFSYPGIYRKFFNKITFSFILGNIASGISCFIYALYRNIRFNVDAFAYGDFSIFLHTSYASMFMVFAVCILIANLNHLSPFAGKAGKWLIFLAIFLLCVAIYLDSSRAGMLSLVLILLFAIFYYSKPKKHWFRTIFLMFAFLVVTGSVLFFHPRVHYIQRFNNILEQPNLRSSHEGLLVRFFIIKEAVVLIRENIFFGTGTGDVKDAIVERYKRSGMQIAYDKKLNIHNQFIETCIGIGAAGLVLLGFITLFPGIHGIKKGNYLKMAFSLMIITNFLFESMLNTQAGVVFFAFFYSLLMVQDIPHKGNAVQQQD